MAAIVEPGRLAEVEAVCARWQLPCTAIGHVTDDGQLRCRWEGEVVGDMPAGVLADAPRYPLHAERPDTLAEQSIAAGDVPEVADPGDLLLRLLAAPDICAKTWVYEQYDQVVGSGTVTRPGSDAGVVRLTPSDRAIAVALDGDGARVALDPRRGAAEAVAQAALNVACSGAEPAAITNCLNFGNPERPGTAYALREAITGMAEACEVLGTPVVSGNVSLYNESGGRPIHPTPVVGCVGVLERADSAVPLAPAGKSGALFLLGGPEPVYDGSEWQALVAGEAAGRIPEVDLPALRWLTDLLFGLAREGGGLVRSAHDASDGGLAVALAEIALAADAGLEVTLEPRTGAAEMLFGECCGLVVVSCAPEDEAKLSEACDAAGVPVEKIGALGGATIALRCGELTLDVALADARAAYEGTLPHAMAAV
jgi:phosphoribosylformylglycinamidine synthase